MKKERSSRAERNDGEAPLRKENARAVARGGWLRSSLSSGGRRGREPFNFFLEPQRERDLLFKDWTSIAGTQVVDWEKDRDRQLGSDYIE